MLIQTILNAMTNYKSFTFGEAKMDPNSNVIHVKVKPRENGSIICSRCGNPATYYDSLEDREYKFLPCFIFEVLFTYKMRRVKCSHCGKICVEKVPWGEGKSPITKELKAELAREAKRNAVKDSAERYNVSWQEVNESVHDAVKFGLRTRDISDVRAIGIDEIAWKKGHRYITVVYQIDIWNRRLLWVGENREKSTIMKFFKDMESFCPGFCRKLETVCTDMWRPYMDAVAMYAPQAKNIIDRFHIVKMINQALDNIRNMEYKRLSANGNAILARSKYCFLKNPDNLTRNQHLKLQELLSMNLVTCEAYLLKEQFRVIWERSMNVESARIGFTEWIKTVLETKLEPLKAVAKTIKRKLDLILNYFQLQSKLSSGVVEGLNRKINLSIRKAYGFRTLESVNCYLLHHLGNLNPLPVVHRFY